MPTGAAAKAATGGLSRVVQVSPALKKFLGVGECSRPESMKRVWDYIKDQKLQVCFSGAIWIDRCRRRLFCAYWKYSIRLTVCFSRICCCSKILVRVFDDGSFLIFVQLLSNEEGIQMLNLVLTIYFKEYTCQVFRASMVYLLSVILLLLVYIDFDVLQDLSCSFNREINESFHLFRIRRTRKRSSVMRI